ncbi:MAG TPA: hypothetical protein VFM38_02035 [Candidatus Limnocylindrales bacterium]|nr:hypothetical protein [Candidatus Limnocylindrales bacterium]
MEGTRREEARPAVLGHHSELGHHILAGVLLRQIAPEPEPTDGAEPRGVVEHATTDPRHLVQPLLGVRPLAAEVLQVRGVVEAVADPCPGARGDDLRKHGSVPELDRALLRPVVAHEAQPDDRGAHEAAAGVAERPDEPADERRLEIDVVVEEQHVRGTGTIEQRLAMFGEPTTGHVTDERDRVIPGLEDARRRRDLHDVLDRLVGRTLIGDDDAERRVILPGEARQGDGKSGRAAVRRDQDID